jgi:TolA-binding protein
MTSVLNGFSGMLHLEEPAMAAVDTATENPDAPQETEIQINKLKQKIADLETENINMQQLINDCFKPEQNQLYARLQKSLIGKRRLCPSFKVMKTR